MNRTTAMGIRRHVEATRNGSDSVGTGLRVERNKVRIHRDGTVSAYGRMPNSVVTGWWLVGHVDDILAEIREAART